jgi:hypothetical protein
MTVQTDLSPADWSAFARFVIRRSGQKIGGRFGLWPIALGIGPIIGVGLRLTGLDLHGPSFGAGVITVVLWFIISSRLRMRSLVPSPDGYILGPRSVDVSDAGLRELSQKHDILFQWSAIRSLHDTGQHLFVMVDNNAAIFIPRRSFSGDAEREKFISEVKKRSNISANLIR